MIVSSEVIDEHYGDKLTGVVTNIDYDANPPIACVLWSNGTVGHYNTIQLKTTKKMYPEVIDLLNKLKERERSNR